MRRTSNDSFSELRKWISMWLDLKWPHESILWIEYRFCMHPIDRFSSAHTFVKYSSLTPPQEVISISMFIFWSLCSETLVLKCTMHSGVPEINSTHPRLLQGVQNIIHHVYAIGITREFDRKPLHFWIWSKLWIFKKKSEIFSDESSKFKL